MGIVLIQDAQVRILDADRVRHGIQDGSGTDIDYRFIQQECALFPRHHYPTNRQTHRITDQLHDPSSQCHSSRQSYCFISVIEQRFITIKRLINKVFNSATVLFPAQTAPAICLRERASPIYRQSSCQLHGCVRIFRNA
jgi:hypothetical protein